MIVLTTKKLCFFYPESLHFVFKEEKTFITNDPISVIIIEKNMYILIAQPPLHIHWMDFCALSLW
jgi:hypothetical protein